MLSNSNMTSVLYLLVTFLGILAVSHSCAYHDMLKKMQRRRMENSSPLIGNTNQGSAHYNNPLQQTQSITNYQFNPQPERRRYTAYNTYRGYYNPTNVRHNQRRVYLGEVSSSLLFCPDGSTCLSQSICKRNTIRTLWSIHYSYTCSSRSAKCEDGFVRRNISENVFECQDINECDDEALNQCEHSCLNRIGSFTCKCDTGYVLQGNYSCIDLDECSDKDDQMCDYQCTNTEGGYDCICPEGYTKNNQKKCKDIDECEIAGSGAICGEGERCLNTFGGSRCIAPTPCDEGYSKSQTSSGDESGPCVIHANNTSIQNAVTAISEVVTPLPLNYARGNRVLQFATSTSIYKTTSYAVIEGGDRFTVANYRGYRRYRGYQSGVYLINTQVLDTPGDINVVVEVATYDMRMRLNTRSHIRITFIVSKYDFY